MQGLVGRVTGKSVLNDALYCVAVQFECSLTILQ